MSEIRLNLAILRIDFLSYEGQINKLREKGCIIDDDSFCRNTENSWYILGIVDIYSENG